MTRKSSVHCWWKVYTILSFSRKAHPPPPLPEYFDRPGIYGELTPQHIREAYEATLCSPYTQFAVFAIQANSAVQVERCAITAPVYFLTRTIKEQHTSCGRSLRSTRSHDDASPTILAASRDAGLSARPCVLKEAPLPPRGVDFFVLLVDCINPTRTAAPVSLPRLAIVELLL